ncbi:MAG: hypothetical protein OXC40_05215 [Proteobacteria bacterium]|nr:hypothetical protein [Pseudomonadota bacterium]
MKTVYLILIFLVIHGCYPKPVTMPFIDKDKDDNDVTSELSSDDLDEEAPSLNKLDPENAKITIDSLQLAPIDDDQDAEKIHFPLLRVTFEGANFVKVLRCKVAKKRFFVSALHGNKKFTFNEFQQALDSDSSSFRPAQYKYFWNSANKSAKSGCEYLGTHVVRERIFDFAAPSGDWYYLINPCVSTFFSSTGKEECSNRLVQSPEMMDYVPEAETKNIELADDISKLEGEAYVIAEKIIGLAFDISAAQKYCEEGAAIDAHNASVDQGWAKIIGAGIGVIVGMVMAPFVGPSAIRHGLKFGMEMFSDGKVPAQRYYERLKCDEANKKLAHFVDAEKELQETRQEVFELRQDMATHDARMNMSQEIINSYTGVMSDN